ACHVDQFKCYRAKGGRSTAQTIDVSDDFGASRLVVGRASGMCNPASDGGPLEDAQTHWSCQRAKSEHGTPFEHHTVRLADRNGAAVIDPQVHFTCYTVRDTSGSRFSPHSIDLVSAVSADTLFVRRRWLLCVPSTTAPCARVTFTSTAGSPNCGGPGLEPAPAPPFSGAVYDAATGGAKIADLGSGCIYFGGGDSEYYPAAQNVAGGSVTLEAQSCTGNVLS